ncbi:nanoRNase/pAp phosphatase (c-di-AMP/oligoRNAs hydrolase) [Desulfobaculum xiamenense]|uniref:NanoRNase/pAp phosphatase (C-di-AMP/oligoRNAs hydrolase) n=1 Tax=Desulfobaculum xiamenense TaxID=995050 RepID=A0A846QJ37_9BACT|nr:DHH family phosphoesterase [Desulfobaculum xiamenense]NJB68248.1 nanoRNase/pAp phosphatase (c-di-AMP/oligoRNAs hydrolase) [Desulfobaculum xiamenense]
MAYFRSIPRLDEMLALFRREERWLIIINADPDALASAMALKRIMARRVQDCGIAHINEISRPDNLEMIRCLRIPTRRLTPNVAAQYDRFALVDSQPHHSDIFSEYRFSVIIDHHPLSAEKPATADYVDIKPEYGSNSSILTQYLYNLRIRPGKLLATALLYGIKTDTSSFERSFCEADMRAFQYLSKHADHLLLRKVYRSEFHLEWLRYFCQAYFKLRLTGQGIFAYLEEVDSPDILVILADLFMRVQGAAWTVISGTTGGRVVAVFRGDGLRRDMGRFAARCFGDVGSAGGHRNAARAEIPLDAVDGVPVEVFLWNRLKTKKTRVRKPSAEAGEE